MSDKYSVLFNSTVSQEHMRLPVVVLTLSPRISERFERMWGCLESIFSVGIDGRVQMTMERDHSVVPSSNHRFSIHVQLPSDNNEEWILNLCDSDPPALSLARVTFMDEIFQRNIQQFLIDVVGLSVVDSAVSGEQWFLNMKNG